MFTDGLPHDLYRDILQLNNPQNYDEWKDAALRRQVEYVHCKNRCEQLQGMRIPKLYNPFVKYPHDKTRMPWTCRQTEEGSALPEQKMSYTMKGTNGNNNNEAPKWTND
jgi:hypothetical protein